MRRFAKLDLHMQLLCIVLYDTLPKQNVQIQNLKNVIVS